MPSEDITSKDYLDSAFKNAKIWCMKNLPKYVNKIIEIDYNSFSYEIDNEMLGIDMGFKSRIPVIYVSTRKLKWLLEREKHFENLGNIRYANVDEQTIKILNNVEVDPESMFIHEIVEFIFGDPQILFNNIEDISLLSVVTAPHDFGSKMENKNRIERNLKPWPEY